MISILFFLLLVVGIGAKTSLHKRQETSRIESRFNELKCIFDKNFHSRFKVSSKISLEEFIPKDSIRSYFDLGCGNGLITARIGNYFHLEKELIYGGDVFNSQNQQITFVSIDQNQSIIDLSKNEFLFHRKSTSF